MDFERQERFISFKCKFYFNLNDNAKMIKRQIIIELKKCISI